MYFLREFSCWPSLYFKRKKVKPWEQDKALIGVSIWKLLEVLWKRVRRYLFIYYSFINSFVRSFIYSARRRADVRAWVRVMLRELTSARTYCSTSEVNTCRTWIFNEGRLVTAKAILDLYWSISPVRDSKSGHGGIVGVTISNFFPRRCSSDRFVSNPTPQSKDQTGDSVHPLPAKHKHMPALPQAVTV